MPSFSCHFWVCWCFFHGISHRISRKMGPMGSSAVRSWSRTNGPPLAIRTPRWDRQLRLETSCETWCGHFAEIHDAKWRSCGCCWFLVVCSFVFVFFCTCYFWQIVLCGPRHLVALDLGHWLTQRCKWNLGSQWPQHHHWPAFFVLEPDSQLVNCRSYSRAHRTLLVSCCIRSGDYIFYTLDITRYHAFVFALTSLTFITFCIIYIGITHGPSFSMLRYFSGLASSAAPYVDRQSGCGASTVSPTSSTHFGRAKAVSAVGFVPRCQLKIQARLRIQLRIQLEKFGVNESMYKGLVTPWQTWVC